MLYEQIGGRYESLRERVKAAGLVKPPPSGLTWIETILALVSPQFFNIYPDALAFIQQRSWERNTTLTPDIATLIQLVIRGEVSETDFARFALKTGYESNISRAILEASKQTLNPADYVNLWRRGLLDERSLLEGVKIAGFRERDLDLLKHATEVRPGPSDVVRFAVREVYTPATAAKYGLFEDFPPEFEAEAKKSGLAPEFAKQYWGAHWELPSLTQGYEMYHRGVIDADELSELMRAQDVMPFWRDRLREISHNPLTRVDVRRMYGFGVLKEEDVYKSYKDIGYSDENARRMTDFTIKYEEDSQQGLTRASITKAFKTDLLTETEFIEYLTDIGYSHEAINLYLQQAKMEILQDRIDAESADLELLYMQGAIEENELRTILSGAGGTSHYINGFINKLKRKILSKRKNPTRADLDRWLEKGIIKESYYQRKMSLIGYLEEDITLYMTELLYDEQHEKVKRLPIKTYQKWYKDNIISDKEFRRVAGEIGYTSEDINNLLREARDEGDKRTVEKPD